MLDRELVDFLRSQAGDDAARFRYLVLAFLALNHDTGSLPQSIEDAVEFPYEPTAPPTLFDVIRMQERLLVISALERHGGNVSRAADALGLLRPTLAAKLTSMGLQTRASRRAVAAAV